MTSNHIDQLAEWWENAEEGEPRPGDEVIVRYVREADGGVALSVTTWPGTPVSDADTRILGRAPKPKPAWHDAVAVMARSVNAPEGHRETFIRSEATPGVWIGEGGYGYSYDLRDVTPLIEAKITDEMVERAVDGASVWTSKMPDSLARAMLTAALGLETT